MTLVARTLAALALAACAIFNPARADDLQDISQFLKSGQHAQALERVNRYLATRPKDAQGRFLKGLILAEQNKTADAIDVFTKLSQDYPELPEPYNNVAVLYASQGQYEKARQALEMSIRTHPAYATAYENLGDLYSKLASQAYDKALQLDSSNTVAKTKLALMTELISNGSRQRASSPAAPASPPARVAEAPKAPSAPPVAAPAPAPVAKPAPATPAAPAAPAPVAKPTPAPAEPKNAKAEKAGESDEVLAAVRAWAHAWSKKDTRAYFAAYAPGFKTPGGEPRAAWETARKQRIAAPKQIEVDVEAPKVALDGANAASVTFRQSYRSDTLSVTSTKTLAMVKTNGKWLIEQERVGR